MFVVRERVLGDAPRLADACPESWHNLDGQCYRLFRGPYTLVQRLRVSQRPADSTRALALPADGRRPSDGYRYGASARRQTPFCSRLGLRGAHS